jgi:gas vesicle protein
MNEQLKVIISAEIGKFKQNVDNAKKTIKDFATKGIKDLDKFKEDLEKVGETSKKFLTITAGAVAGAATALLALGASTKEYRQQQAQLATAFETAGGSAESAKKTYNDLYRVLGDGGQATEAAQHLAKLTTEEKALNEWTTICQGVYATFGQSLPIESLTEAVNHSAKLGEVQGTLADALEWSGISVDEFNEQLFWCNSESEREKLIRDTLNGLYTDAASAYEKNNAAVLEQNDAQAKLAESMAKLGEATAPVMAMLTELGAEIMAQLAPYIQEFAEKYGKDIKDVLVKIGEAIGNVITWIADNWDIVKGVAAVVLAIAAALAIVSTALTVYNAVMAITTVVSAPIIAIILAIVAAVALLIVYWDDIAAFTKKCWDAIVNAVKVAVDWVISFINKIISFVKENWQGLLLLLVNPFAGAFKLIYDNCEGFRNTINKLLNSVKDIFTKIGSTIKEKFNAAATTVKSIIDKIKGFFKFEWSLPKLKVPKFSITPSGWEIGDLLKGVIPKLGITWNAKGGVFDKPTLFNYGDSLQGIGENGAEAVVPLENNLEWLSKLADMLSERMGNTPIVLQVDGKTFAKTSISTINNLTRQSGKLGLVIQ